MIYHYKDHSLVSNVFGLSSICLTAVSIILFSIKVSSMLYAIAPIAFSIIYAILGIVFSYKNRKFFYYSKKVTSNIGLYASVASLAVNVVLIVIYILVSLLLAYIMSCFYLVASLPL